MAEAYITSPDDAVVAPSGWAKVGDVWQTVEPLRDKATGLYARLTYAGARTALARLGLRMPTRTDVDARLAATPSNLVLPVVALPDAKILRDLAAQGIARTNYPAGPAGAEQFDKASRRDMTGLEWARYYDGLMQALLDKSGWDGRALISNLGKMWIGGASPGRALLKGWWDAKRGAWTQQGTAAYGQEFHEDSHHDYGTLTYGVSDTDPSLRTDATSMRPAPSGTATSVAAGAGGAGAARLALRDTQGPLFDATCADAGGPGSVKSLLLFGDSLAVGLTTPLGAFAKAADVPFKGDGFQSSTIQNWLGKLRPHLLADLAAMRSAFVLVSLGTNDMRSGDPAAEGRRAGELLTLLKQNGAGTIGWITPPEMPFESAPTEAFRSALDDVCRQAGAKVFESRMYGFDRAKDKIHFTEKGYRDWASAIADWLDLQGANTAPDTSPPPAPPPGPASTDGYFPAKNVTRAMLDWIDGILHDPAHYALGATADRTFGARVMQARVETHPPDKNIPRPHRGVGLWELQGGRPAPPSPRPTPAPSGDEAPALVVLRDQINRSWPARKKNFDGILASVEHNAKNPTSDHAQGNALDVTTDTAKGPNLDLLAEALLADPRVAYVIWRGRIANNKPSITGKHRWAVGEWRRYPTSYMIEQGSQNTDPHVSHLHVSLVPGAREEMALWDLSTVKPGPWQFAPQAPLPPERDWPDDGSTGPETVFVARLGELPVEEYLARVVTGELGGAERPSDAEAARAQAIAARTFLRYAMSVDPALGTRAKPLPNSTAFQVAAPSAKPFATAAVSDTRGVTIEYQGKPITANFVAGAVWKPGARSGEGGKDQGGTEKRVTYNSGLSGADVHPTSLVLKVPQNRGAMSQNGALALARMGWKWPEILHFFYGADVDFTRPGTPERPVPERPAPEESIAREGGGSGGAGLLAVAAALALGFGFFV